MILDKVRRASWGVKGVKKMAESAEGSGERPIGWFNYGCSCLDAAEHLVQAIEQRELTLRFDSPVSFLIGHGLELLIKAFLRSAGMTDAQVEKLRHNLETLLSAAAARSLNFELTELEQGHVALLNRDFGGRLFAIRYLRTGAKQVHDDRIVLAAARRLEGHIRPEILASMHGG